MQDLLIEIFYDVDNYCIHFEEYCKNYFLSNDESKPSFLSSRTLCLSEVMSITIYFHLSGYRTFKTYYKEHVSKVLKPYFPKLVSYNRFVELMQEALLPLLLYMKRFRTGKCTGISFIDSTKLVVCHNKRIYSHKVFKEIAKRGKSSKGWFYGFKLHLVVSDIGEVLSFYLTPGNVDDRNETVLENLTKELFGKLFGDRGYISQKLYDILYFKGVQLITKLKKNMKNKIMVMEDKILLRKRAIIETINDHLKNVCQIEHSRHRSFTNFMVNIVAGLVAYSFLPKKPSLKLDKCTAVI
ncbi:IS982 family transposase [Clostridium ljungdahlii]|uniref:Transposase DDE domain protein n=1 Tax=Clostridium ljungdahlii TaxID=1538 RepID=A0A168NUD9_9CLOT|nr:IS982 family transposase [Clostridium ljungdahlii]OAA86920.1 Transposase DDE domain protein [Clostridium ljungdahlii]